MSKNSAQLIGDKELQRMFKTLGDRVQRKVARQAVNAGATPISKAAQAGAPEESGALKLALKGGKRLKTYKESGTVVAIIGPRTNVKTEVDGRPRVPAHYARLAEDGHIAANGEYVPGHPFLRPAFDQNESASLGIITDKLAAGVVKEAKAALIGGGS